MSVPFGDALRISQGLDIDVLGTFSCVCSIIGLIDQSGDYS